MFTNAFRFVSNDNRTGALGFHEQRSETAWKRLEKKKKNEWTFSNEVDLEKKTLVFNRKCSLLRYEFIRFIIRYYRVMCKKHFVVLYNKNTRSYNFIERNCFLLCFLPKNFRKIPERVPWLKKKSTERGPK